MAPSQPLRTKAHLTLGMSSGLDPFHTIQFPCEKLPVHCAYPEDMIYIDSN